MGEERRLTRGHSNPVSIKSSKRGQSRLPSAHHHAVRAVPSSQGAQLSHRHWLRHAPSPAPWLFDVRNSLLVSSLTPSQEYPGALVSHKTALWTLPTTVTSQGWEKLGARSPHPSKSMSAVTSRAPSCVPLLDPFRVESLFPPGVTLPSVELPSY